MSSPTVYCWDVNVILAYMLQDSSAPLADIDLVVGEIDRNEAILLVPVTAYMEILEAKNTPEQMAEVRAFLQRSNVEVANITQPIAEKVGQIRSRGLLAKPLRKIEVPDATYLATALLYKADVFHTCEEGMLLNLNGSDIVEKLLITKPKPLKGTSSYLTPSPSEPEPPSSPELPAGSS